MSMTPVAPGISRGLSFISSLGRPAGASFTAAEIRERCRHQLGHVSDAAVLCRAKHDNGNWMVGACIDHDDEIAASEVGVAGFRK